MHPPDRPRRQSLLPVPTAMRGSRLPKPAGTFSVSPSPRRCHIKRHAAHASTQINVRPPDDPAASANTTTSAVPVPTTSISPGPPSSGSFSPHLAASSSSRHKHSPSVDSGIGSSVASSSAASNNGDAPETTHVRAPAIPVPATFKEIAVTSSPLPPPPRSVPRSDCPTVNAGSAVETTAAGTVMGHDDELGRLVTMTRGEPPQTPPWNSSPNSPEDASTPSSTVSESSEDSEHDTIQDRLVIAAEVANNALKKLLGIALESLELQDTVISVTEIYLQELTDIVKKDTNCGASALTREPEKHETPSKRTYRVMQSNCRPTSSQISIDTGSEEPGGPTRIPDFSARDLSSTPCTDQEPPSTQQSSYSGGANFNNSFASRPQKRVLRSTDDGNDEDMDEQNRKDKRRARSTGRGIRESADRTPYSCPFRKRDPTTFHVRDYVRCANQPWIGMANLKKHITSDHYSNNFPCPRCRGNFGSPEGVRDHLQSLEPCRLRTSPDTMARLEDGISQTVRDILASRQDHKKVNTWRRLWIVLFGEGVPIEDSNFVPVVELEEILVEFETQLPPFVTALEAQLKGLLGDIVYPMFRQEVGIINTFVQKWIRELFEQCRAIPFQHPNPEVPVASAHQIRATQVNNMVTDPAFSNMDNRTEFGPQSRDNLPELDSTVNASRIFLQDWDTAGFANELTNNSMMATQYYEVSNNATTTQHSEIYHRPHQIAHTHLPYHAQINNHAATYNSVHHGPPAPPTPIPTPPDTTQHGSAISQPPPPFNDPAAHRALAMSVSHQNARQQQREQPHVPLHVQKFHERCSGSGKPLSRTDPGIKPIRDLRDSGVSDVGSSYSGYESAWQVNGAASPASPLTGQNSYRVASGNDARVGGGFGGYSVEPRTFFNTDDDDE